jgi:hypothetical protein
MAHASTDTLAIHVMDRTDLDQAIDWAAAEGWNPGLKDAECFQQDFRWPKSRPSLLVSSDTLDALN